jgi:8-oxo-dGTP diphosphatase
MSSREHHCPQCHETWYCSGCDTEAEERLCDECKKSPPALVTVPSDAKIMLGDFGETFVVPYNGVITLGDTPGTVPNADRRPKVGVGIFVRRPDGGILMGQRLGSHGAGTWSIPGGLVEADETLLQAAQRELGEETGLELELPNFRALLAPGQLSRFYDKPGGRQAYVTLYVLVDVSLVAQAIVREPTKCAEWRWVDESWPGELFDPLDDLFDAVNVRGPGHLRMWLKQA